MPTPFMHLDIAQEIRTQIQEDGAGNGRHLTNLISSHWAAFCLGHIAPDFSFLANVSRFDTHFYHIPPEPGEDPVALMLTTHPFLANAAALPDPQKLFIAGYLAHLLLDFIWFQEIVMPYFWQKKELGEPAQRRLLHFILLTYLDAAAGKRLQINMAATLYAAEPHEWLPYGNDLALNMWRDMVAAQLEPGAKVRTTEIYARRLKMDQALFEEHLNNTGWLESQLFRHISQQSLHHIFADSVTRSVNLITHYLYSANFVK